MSYSENVMVMNTINAYSSIIANQHTLNHTLYQIEETTHKVDKNISVATLLSNLNILKKKMLILHGLYLHD